MSGLLMRQPFHGITDTVPKSDRVGVTIEEGGQLGIRQQTVIVNANTETGNFTISLPSVTEAAGLIYSIRARIANTRVVTVTDAGDGDLSDQTLDTDGDHVLLYSDGLSWHVLVDGIAT